MLLVTWRNLIARKIRLLMSALAIVLGVAFVAGSLVFTDTMSSTFDNIINGTVSDVNVRFKNVGDSTDGGAPSGAVTQTVDASVVKELGQLPGAKRVDGQIQQYSLFVTKTNGKLLGGTGAPTLTYNWTGTVNSAGKPIVKIVRGRAPRADGEVVLDRKSAQEAGYTVGDKVKLVSAGNPPVIEATLVGLGEFTGGGLGGSTLVIFDTATAQKIFFDGRDVYNGISVEAKSGVSQGQLARQVALKLPKGMEAVTGRKLAEESKSLVGKLLGFFSTFLLVFAAIALVVGTFLIVNTFSILVAQRSRELALLRAMGASRRQVMTSVLIEAAVVGFIGSTVGLLLGVLLAQVLKVLFSNFGLDLSGTSLVLSANTVVVSYLIGIIVTVIAAVIPARRAASIPPVAAMRDDVAMPESSLHRRVQLAGLAGLVGALLMIAGLFFDVPKATLQVGIGIFLLLMAVAAASPLLARPVLALAGRAYRRFGAVGSLATENARRNPRRTSATASALMIGLALVTTISILGASTNKSIDVGVDEQFNTDFLVSNVTGAPFSTTVADQVRGVKGVAAVAPSQTLAVQLGKTTRSFTAVSPSDLTDIYKVKFSSGRAPERDDEIALSKSRAKDLKLRVGSKINVTVNGQWSQSQVTGIYPDSYILAGGVLPLSVLDARQVPRQDTALAVNVSGDADAVEVGRAIETATKDNPTITVQSKQDFADTQHASVSTLLNLVYALLGLAIVIAVLGIINTLSLSVIERTREVGLLRAVGLSRTQLRQMIRLESVAIAVLGALLGVVSGIVFGIALQRALEEQGITNLSIPIVSLTVFVLLSAVVGVVAAIIPAWRASKLNILQAIATVE